MKDLKQSIGYFVKYMKPFKNSVFIMVFLLLIAMIAQVVAPYYMGQAVTSLGRFLAHKAHAMADFRQFMLLMCAAFFFQVFAQLVAWVIMSVFNAEATNSMRISLFKKLQKMTIRYFDTHQDGKLLALFNSDIDNIFNALNGAIFDLVSQTILFVGTIVVMFAINVKLALVTMASTPIVVLIAFSVMKKARKYLDEQQEDISVLNGYINEQLNGERIILANGLQKSSIAGFVKKNDKLRKTMFRGQFYSGLMFPMMQGLSMLNLAIVISVGTLIVVESGMSLAVGMGLIVTFVQYSQTYFIPLINLTSFYLMIQLALTGAKRLSDVEAEKEEDEVSSGINMQGINESVALKDVHFSYEKGKEILHGINLTIPRGKTLALVGPTGSGKTTTMNLFSRFYDVDSGTVEFDGTDVRKFSLDSVRNHIGIVLQDSILFTGTIADNIRFGKPDATMEEVRSAAQKAQIADFIESLPDGYETKISDEQSLFSKGQKQLMSIARTLLSDPEFLVLDEATSNVDTVTEEKIQKAMDIVMEGRTSFVIAHRLKTIVNADEIAVLKDGSVIEQGSHEELLEKGGFYHNLYVNQMVLD